jgi:hypothetical protein
MLRRFLSPVAVLLPVLLLVPACGSPATTARTGKGGATFKDQPPPEPKAAGRSG